MSESKSEETEQENVLRASRREPWGATETNAGMMIMPNPGGISRLNLLTLKVRGTRNLALLANIFGK